jgi:quinol monooxygenase YgiN
VSVVVVATITPQPEAREAVREAILRAVPRVHAEPGCELYALHEAQDGNFVMIERWESPEAVAVHSQAEALRELGADLRGKVTGRPALSGLLTPVPAGEDGKGAL